MTQPSLNPKTRDSLRAGLSSRITANRLYKAFGLGVLAVVIASAFAACGQEANDPRALGESANGGNGGQETAGSAGNGGSAGFVESTEVCQAGLTRECVVTLDKNGDVLSCYHGTQTCLDGAWSPCQDGAVAYKLKGNVVSSEKPGAPQNVLTTCTNNPCDPTCQTFDEDPDGGLKSSGQTPVFTWQTGDLGAFPPTLVGQGIHEPCTTGYDCQFNQYCSAPALITAQHNICAPGQALDRNTNACVDLICPIDQTCCTTTYAGTCNHDYCDLGGALTNGCDTCVNQICAADPNCCGGTCAHSYCDVGTALSTGCDSCVNTVCAKDPKCCNLPTQGTCSHDYCSTGAALTTGCDSCVSAVCAADPFCCGPDPTNAACGHSYCTTGTKLVKTCDPCVTKVCNQRSQCCNNSWNQTCVNLVAQVCNTSEQCTSWDSTCVAEVGSVCGQSCTAGWGQNCVDKTASLCGKSCQWTQSCKDKVGTVCGKSCGPFEWKQSCVDKVGSVCGDVCYPDPPCTHNKCDSGEKLVASCDPCVTKICQQLPDCCNVEWTNLCVDRVKTLCGEGCNVKGDCVPWLPAQKDPTCAGYDLTVGVPCGSTVPVCNHGNTTVPAGVRLVHFPQGSGQFAKCNPNQSNPQMLSCTTALPIAPGKCVNVSASSCGLGAGAREIMVNPPAYNGSVQLPECKCQDNWSIWAGPNVACQAPNCSNTTTATLKRVNMFIQLDKSGSMSTSLGNGDTRWSATIKALKAFVQDTGSAGLGVALRFWGDNSPVSGCDDVSCSATACKSPLVNIGVLKLATGAADAQETALVNALNSKSPGGNTPMYPALDGATQWAIAYKATHPTEETIVVFATDGEPNGCNEDPTAIANIAGAAFSTYGVKTYAIGIQDANPILMNSIASKGGTNKGFFVAPGANVQNDFLSAMIAIKGDTLGCDFIVPGGGLYDPSVAVVTYTPSTGSPVNLTNVANLAACGANNWYYDNPANPTQLKLCPTICSTILSDSGAKIGVDLGCPGDYEPVSYDYPYESVCPTGSKVQWQFLTYDSLTPADSKIEWSVRTATTLAGLQAKPWIKVATSKASPDTQVCGMGGPAPCPISVFNALGPLDSRNTFLELLVTLYPATTKASAAVVKSWDVSYSCPPSE